MIPPDGTDQHGTGSTTPVPAAGQQGRETTTEKLGAITDQPPDSAFALKRRMPGWRPDTQANCAVKLYQEEALGVLDGKWLPFPPPEVSASARSRKKRSFAEPGKRATAADWNKFNTWILGHPIDGSKPFDDFLREIADQVRRYNAALYWMRRLHFVENAPPGSPPPPRNPAGDKDDPDPDHPTQPLEPLDPSSPKFDIYVMSAERAWKREVARLNQILGGHTQSRFTDIVADMVEVNSYIVSMRIIANENTSGPIGNIHRPRTEELGGSSSSHVSISSALSSPHM